MSVLMILGPDFVGENKMKRNFDFVEIGTSDFETLTQTAGSTDLGIAIEPMRCYLNNLPNKPGVIKICAAMVTEIMFARSNEIDVFYVDEKTYTTHNLGGFLRGCNSVGKPHDFHVKYYHDPTTWHLTEDKSRFQTINLLDAGLVKNEKVPCITYKGLMEQYKIGHIKLLKTDLEGLDGPVLIDALNYYKNNNLTEYLPKTIQFEDNSHSDKVLIKQVKEILKGLSYSINEQYHETYATLR